MWKWLKKRLAPALWRLEMEARVELAEAMLGDLRDRFTRFQNRENMRGARQQLGMDDQLASQVASILDAQKSPSEANPAQAKLDLWKARQHK